MSMNFPPPVDQIMSQCVSNVSARLLPSLQTANPAIQQLGFMFGHGTEIINLLNEMSKGTTTRYQKFPCVMLFGDIQSGPSSVKGAYGDVTLNMVIAMSTEAKYLTAERIAVNFDPILRPIYQELIQEIARCGFFWVQSPRQILGHDIERMYWGREQIQGNNANKMNDYIDAIEIKSLKLTQSKAGNSLVPTLDVIPANSWLQFISYFLAVTKAEILVGAVNDNTISNNFFLNKITEIAANSQDYIADVDFTQLTDANGKYTGAIKGINIQFYQDQTILAKR